MYVLRAHIYPRVRFSQDQALWIHECKYRQIGCLTKSPVLHPSRPPPVAVCHLMTADHKHDVCTVVMLSSSYIFLAIDVSSVFSRNNCVAFERSTLTCLKLPKIQPSVARVHS